MGNCSFGRFTHQFAKAYINKHKPNLLFISYGETDDFAHDGDYESYLKSTRNTDALIKDLWEFYQGNSYYKDKTTFIITLITEEVRIQLKVGKVMVKELKVLMKLG